MVVLPVSRFIEKALIRIPLRKNLQILLEKWFLLLLAREGQKTTEHNSVLLLLIFIGVDHGDVCVFRVNNKRKTCLFKCVIYVFSVNVIGVHHSVVTRDGA